VSRWQDAIDKAGGEDKAMLYGSALKELLADLRSWQTKHKAMQEQRDSARAEAIEANTLVNSLRDQADHFKRLAQDRRKELDPQRALAQRGRQLYERARWAHEAARMDKLAEAIKEYET
jgi:hypothetical protein